MRALLLAATALALTAAAPVPPSPVAGVAMTFFNLPSDPPGEQRMAPGGGRVLTPVVQYTPASGENIHGPAIVFLSKGPGSNPGYAGQASRWAAERLAAKGYTVLSLQSHADRGWPFFPFEETVFEIDAALDSLEMRGYEDFILIGEGYGAAEAAHYLANDPDKALDKPIQRRVHAAVLLDPLTELRAYPGIDLGPRYDAVIARAEKAFAGGHNGYTKSRSMEVAGGPDAGNDSWLGTGFFVAPAEAILNYWGPAADARNRRAYRDNPVPALALANRGNATVSGDALRRIAADRPTGGFDIEMGDGASFAPAGYDAATDRIAAWLAAKGMGVRPKVEERLVDVTAADGRPMSAALYLPEHPDPKRPALLLTHGRSGEPIQSSTHWMGWRFAQQGYAVLAPAFRISGPAGIYTATRKDMTQDLGSWMNWLDAAGYKRVIAAGHSNGGIWNSDYVALSGDKRIEGLIYFAPTVNVETWKERQANKAGMAQMREACAAVQAGRGSDVVFGVQNATLVCDSLNKDAVSHPERLARVTVPGLFLIGGNDALFKRPGVRDRLSKAYAGTLDTLIYEGGSHGFRESKDRLAGDVDAWIAKTFPDQR